MSTTRPIFARRLRPLILLFTAGCAASGASSVITKGSPGFDEKVAELATNKGAVLSTDAERQIEPVALFYGPMPTGIAVSKSGRVFVNFPRWGDPVDNTAAEIVDGKLVPFPDAIINKLDKDHPATTLVSVQSVVCDTKDRLWILDTGSIDFNPILPGGPKLIAVDLATNRIVQTISFPPDVALPTSYMNDVRFDLKRGSAGTAYLTDSSVDGPNGLVVVDLATGQSWRRLSDHPSTKAEKIVTTCEGRPLLSKGKNPNVGSDGIAVTPDGKSVYYCPMIGHHLYRVSANALADRTKSDADVAATVKDLGDRGFGSDGLECGPDGTLYLTDYEHGAIRRRKADGTYAVLCSDSRILWPDSMAFGGTFGVGSGPMSDFQMNWYGTLYFTSNQLERQSNYHDGHDNRKAPYALFAVNTDWTTVSHR
jgi:sugar lactone lactonase YvrE